MTQPSSRVAEAATIVEGTAAEVWALVATGPGISTWLLPAIVEQEPGGTILQRLGPGEEDVSRGTIRIYDAPRRFLYEESSGRRTIATEFLVEPMSHSSCRVRILTHGLTAADAAVGTVLVVAWTQALASLRISLAFLRGRPAASLRVQAQRDGDLVATWREARHRLGLTDADGRPVRLADDTATVAAGPVASVQPSGLLAGLDRPHPGVLSVSATAMNGSTQVILDRFVDAADAAAAAQEERPWWECRLTVSEAGTAR
jgi:hypothetical protein